MIYEIANIFAMRIGTSRYIYNLGRISKMTQADLDYMMRMLSDRKKHIDKTHFITLSMGRELESINRCLKFLDRQQEDI